MLAFFLSIIGSKSIENNASIIGKILRIFVANWQVYLYLVVCVCACINVNYGYKQLHKNKLQLHVTIGLVCQLRYD